MARYGIWSRDSKDGKDVKWFEVDAHFAFHYGSAWDSVNDKGEHVVTVYAVAYQDTSIEF